MKRTGRLVFCVAMALLLLTARTAIAAPSAAAEKEKERVLRQLDDAAKNFRSTTADFEFDSVQTDPVYDKDVQRGVAYYERKGSTFKMAAHIRDVNGKPVPKVYVYSGGVLRLYEKMIDQVTTLSKVSQYESYLMLGFGASGRDLERKWNITYLGSETLPDGKAKVKTEKLELVAKDPAVRKNVRKVILWLDTDRGVSMKQFFDEGPGQQRSCFYFNIRVNQSLPSDAFTFKTGRKTAYVNR
jgi:outer membrane lipoprotein-sorting protein